MLPPMLRAGALLLLALPCSAVESEPNDRPEVVAEDLRSSSWGSDPWFTKDGHRKQFVLACNGYADKKPAIVGIRTQDHIGEDAEAATLSLPLRERGGLAHFLRHKESDKEVSDKEDGSEASEVSLRQRRSAILRGSGNGKGALIPELAKGGGAHSWALRKQAGKPGSDAVWGRPIPYGTCQEYHVDMTTRRMFFVTAGGGSCLLAGDASSSEDDEPKAQRFVVVLTQKSAQSSDCAVVAMGLDRGPSATASEIAGTHGVSAELALMDAFAQDHPLVPYKDDAEDAAEEHERWQDEEQEEGADLAIGAGALLRLEDIVEKQSITQEIVATRAMSLGQVYDVEPKTFHVILEDLRGSEMFDERDVTFEADRTYVAVRLGRAGDPEFPEKLGWFPISASAWPPTDLKKGPKGAPAPAEHIETEA